MGLGKQFFPRRPPPRSRMYTGPSALAFFNPVANKHSRIFRSVLTAETALPRRPPPRSRMYTGVSVLATQPDRRCLPLRN